MRLHNLVDVIDVNGFNRTYWRNNPAGLHVAIGLDHDKHAGSGVPIDYTEEEARKVIAFLRLSLMLGPGVGRQNTAAKTLSALRDMAGGYDIGWVVGVFGDDGHTLVTHTESTEIIQEMAYIGGPFIVLPCTVLGLDSATVAHQTGGI